MVFDRIKRAFSGAGMEPMEDDYVEIDLEQEEQEKGEEEKGGHGETSPGVAAVGSDARSRRRLRTE